MSIILGIDPGVSTGVAIYRAGQLTELRTIAPHEIDSFITEVQPARYLQSVSYMKAARYEYAINAPMAAVRLESEHPKPLARSGAGEEGLSRRVRPASAGAGCAAHRCRAAARVAAVCAAEPARF